MKANTITKITYHDRLPGNTPARVNRNTGELQIDRKFWATLNKDQRFFVLLHEMGHLVENTRDEHTADNWAFNEYAKRGYSLKNGVFALTRMLSNTHPEHLSRSQAQLERAKEYDYLYYGNKDVYNGGDGFCTCKQIFCKKKHKTFLAK